MQRRARSAPCGLAVTHGLVAGSSPGGPTAFRRLQISGIPLRGPFAARLKLCSRKPGISPASTKASVNRRCVQPGNYAYANRYEHDAGNHPKEIVTLAQEHDQHQDNTQDRQQDDQCDALHDDARAQRHGVPMRDEGSAKQGNDHPERTHARRKPDTVFELPRNEPLHPASFVHGLVVHDHAAFPNNSMWKAESSICAARAMSTTTNRALTLSFEIRIRIRAPTTDPRTDPKATGPATAGTMEPRMKSAPALAAAVTPIMKLEVAEDTLIGRGGAGGHPG